MMSPALVVSTITANVTADLALVTAYGVNVTPDQKTAILGVVAVLAPVVAGLITHHKTVAKPAAAPVAPAAPEAPPAPVVSQAPPAAPVAPPAPAVEPVAVVTPPPPAQPL